MKNLVTSNIKKAINKLNYSKASLYHHLNGLYPYPVFYGPKNNIESTQSDFFGFYVLTNAIRSVLRGINFIIVSRSSLSLKLLAPSIATSYTAGFHGLMGYLALHGRSFFDSFNWAQIQSDGKFTNTQRPNDLNLIAAILTKNNRWTFECRNYNHKAYWRELLELFNKQSYIIPRYYYDLFDYLFWGRLKEGKDRIESLKEKFKNPALYEANKLKLEDVKKEFLESIAEIRHGALYKGFGEDTWVVDALWNNEVMCSSGIERQAEEFYKFSEAILDHVSSDLVDLISSLKPEVSVKKALIVCTYISEFDTPVCELITNNTIKCNINLILDWLKLS